ncbi:glycoside hydrolase family 32 protein [Pedobacter sp. P351]|uniref:glycoside hydrolase family 32 protein n=1 Tax=Pedobacter superstes TaxID=3133441 RepID=UPI0030B62AFC
MKTFTVIIVLAALISGCNTAEKATQTSYLEKNRPQFHFSPKEKWMNDPNGMVYHEGIYHLFFQYYPDSTVWGPMHWGHATSKDLVHWDEQPIALYPDSLGYIFSGSAVVDSNNTSGLGKDGKVPLVAIFTHHDPKGEKAGTSNYQNQSLAYSLDNGATWTKYTGNPALKNPGITDFRDPKVSWYAPSKRWIMTLATKDRISFYSSANLKDWKKESEFGQEVGGHGGVWECPDLFPLQIDGKTAWVLLVSINPGGPNGGSATQYFVGNFDGVKFTPFNTATKWVDYGTDNYAGVTWSNTGERKIFLGWMSNWQYANVVPTDRWRSAMTVPRELNLKKSGQDYFLTSQPVKELNTIKSNDVSFENIEVQGGFNLSQKLKSSDSQYQIKLSAEQLKSFSIVLSNDIGEELSIGYDKKTNQYYIDRTKSGKNDFEKGFAKKYLGPRLSDSEKADLTLIVDAASVELFADDGLTAMTGIFFPTKPLNQIQIKSTDSFFINKLNYSVMNRIWK